MARVIIGGIDYEVPELNFVALERAWPFVEEALASLDPMKAPSAGVCIVAAGLIEAPQFQQTDFGIGADENLGDDQLFDRVVRFLKKKLKATEIEKVRIAVNAITEEAGLAPPEGEAPPPAADQEENLSTGIAPTSPPSSSQPDAAEGTGS